MMWVTYHIQLSTKMPLLALNPIFWIDAMKDEMTSMSYNKVWSFVDFLDGCRPIGCKWVFKTKRDAKGHVERYKVRLVANGYNQ